MIIYIYIYQTCGQFTSGIGIDGQFRNCTWNCIIKKIELELIILELELKSATKKLNPQISLPFNFLIQN